MNRSLHEKRRSENMTGLWKGTELIRYILFEDYRNGNVIGFRQDDGVTTTTITGKKNPGGTSQIVERMHDTQQKVQYEVTLFPKEQTIEMRQHDNSIVPHRLQLLEKRLPNPLFHQLERLKKVEKYDGARFLYFDG